MPEHKPVVHILSQGNLANQMIQYIVAFEIASRVPGCEISNVRLDMWGVNRPPLPSTGLVERLVDGQALDVDDLSTQLRTGVISRLNLLAFGQHLDNFPDLDTCRSIFPANSLDYPGYGPDKLVCNIRGGEILDARHPHYTLLPIDYYAEMAERYGLDLVFMGQLEDNLYCDDLRRRFPEAEYRPSQGAIADFQTFRNSCNLVPAVSTFSWLAAWLSHADRIIFPVCGLFHPVQCPDIDLLPASDGRYEYHLFPINFSVPVEQYFEAHDAIRGLWRKMPTDRVMALKQRAGRPVPMERCAALLDEDFYLATYPDVAEAVVAGHVLNGVQHYRTNGFAERRRAFKFDRRWYSRTYPMAAFEVGQGDYGSLLHHYTDIGSVRGYCATPPEHKNL